MIRKTLYTLNISGNYAPAVTAMTYPLLKHYAKKIGAEFFVMTERKFPDWPIVYEKMQIHTLSKERGDDLSIYLDSDAVVHPETIDFSDFIPRDTVAHNGNDFAPLRWRTDDYFRRDGRNIGSCNWNTWAWSCCRDLWMPLDIPFEEARENIYPTVNELVPTKKKKNDEGVEETTVGPQVMQRDHLIDDYALSRNIARYGLKSTTLDAIQKKVGLADANFFFHVYNLPEFAKARLMKATLDEWHIEPYMTRFQ